MRRLILCVRCSEAVLDPLGQHVCHCPARRQIRVPVTSPRPHPRARGAVEVYGVLRGDLHGLGLQRDGVFKAVLRHDERVEQSPALCIAEENKVLVSSPLVVAALTEVWQARACHTPRHVHLHFGQHPSWRGSILRPRVQMPLDREAGEGVSARGACETPFDDLELLVRDERACHGATAQVELDEVDRTVATHAMRPHDELLSLVQGYCYAAALHRHGLVVRSANVLRFLLLGNIHVSRCSAPIGRARLVLLAPQRDTSCVVDCKQIIRQANLCCCRRRRTCAAKCAHQRPVQQQRLGWHNCVATLNFGQPSTRATSWSRAAKAVAALRRVPGRVMRKTKQHTPFGTAEVHAFVFDAHVRVTWPITLETCVGQPAPHAINARDSGRVAVQRHDSPRSPIETPLGLPQMWHENPFKLVKFHYVGLQRFSHARMSARRARALAQQLRPHDTEVDPVVLPAAALRADDEQTVPVLRNHGVESVRDENLDVLKHLAQLAQETFVRLLLVVSETHNVLDHHDSWEQLSGQPYCNVVQLMPLVKRVMHAGCIRAGLTVQAHFQHVDRVLVHEEPLLHLLLGYVPRYNSSARKTFLQERASLRAHLIQHHLARLRTAAQRAQRAATHTTGQRHV